MFRLSTRRTTGMFLRQSVDFKADAARAVQHAHDTGRKHLIQLVSPVGLEPTTP
jgi:hypothetical protein